MLQIRIPNNQALLENYNFIYFSAIIEFAEKLLEGYREQFMALVSEGHLMERTSLKAADSFSVHVHLHCREMFLSAPGLLNTK